MTMFQTANVDSLFPFLCAHPPLQLLHVLLMLSAVLAGVLPPPPLSQLSCAPPRFRSPIDPRWYTLWAIGYFARSRHSRSGDGGRTRGDGGDAERPGDGRIAAEAREGDGGHHAMMRGGRGLWTAPVAPPLSVPELAQSLRVLCPTRSVSRGGARLAAYTVVG